MEADPVMLDIAAIFKRSANELLEARLKSIEIHGTKDIEAAGAEVEQAVRDYYAQILPSKYHVSHGHLIDINGVVSPQIDLIVSDNETLPSLMRTKNGTEYVPIDSIYAIAEIKSTYYKSKKPIIEFSKKIEFINKKMYHPIIKNTAYNGQILDETKLRDMFLGKGNRDLNRIFTFMFFISKNDFLPKDVSKFLLTTDKTNLPDASIFLDSGTLLYAAVTDTNFKYHKYPDQHNDPEDSWYYIPFTNRFQTGSLEGNILGFAYNILLDHLVNSYLEPPSLTNYIANMLVAKKSGIEKL